MIENGIVNKRVQEFINALNKEEEPILLALEKEAHEHHVPIIRCETKEFLRFLLTDKRPKRILEIGTAIGYSAIVMAKCLGADVMIDTIERNEGRYAQAVDNIKAAGMEDIISVHFGDADDILETLSGVYDFVFMDAAKAQYQSFWNKCQSLLDESGMMVCDNILQEGIVAESRYAITRRDHTVHGRMREFLYELKKNDSLDVLILPVGDGIAVVRKKGMDL